MLEEQPDWLMTVKRCHIEKLLVRRARILILAIETDCCFLSEGDVYIHIRRSNSRKKKRAGPRFGREKRVNLACFIGIQINISGSDNSSFLGASFTVCSALLLLIQWWIETGWCQMTRESCSPLPFHVGYRIFGVVKHTTGQ